jgi:2-dehydro-3-deoxyphosphooctonate aldolase (KDO 8-P synthase)
MHRTVTINNIQIGPGQPLALIAGPCVIESYPITHQIASTLKALTQKLHMPLIFKASYDKANRTSIESYRGPGIDKGLRLLADIKQELNLNLISDVHRIQDVDEAAAVLDVIQIPAFLSRQTDLVLAVSNSGKAVNIKKGQFLSPWDMPNVVAKAASTGNHNILITERGSMFGYNNLVVDFRGIPVMQQSGYPVIFDATHSVQLPGGAGTSSGGRREFAPVLARAAVAAGADGIFMEVHPDPDKALCDGPNSLPLETLPELLEELCAIRQSLRHVA